jgi:PAS domain S-box-containing protein
MDHTGPKIEFTEKSFRSLFEKLPTAVYICDAEGRITYFNWTAVEVWGRTPGLNNDAERFCGSFKLYHTDGTPMSHDQYWMALAIENNEEYVGREVVIERPDGSRSTGLAHASPVRDEMEFVPNSCLASSTASGRVIRQVHSDMAVWGWDSRW